MPLSWKLPVDSRGGSGSTELRFAYAPLAQRLPFSSAREPFRMETSQLQVEGVLSEYGIPGNPQGGFTVRLFSAVMLNLAISCCAFGQTYTINTFAGGGLPVNIPGTSASFSSLNYVAVDGAGNVLFTNAHHAVLRLDAKTGVLTLVAGNGTPGYSGDNGPATSAQLHNPRGVAVDAAGNLYIADDYNNRVRKVSNGVITTVAGNGTSCGEGGDNGPATSAQLCGADSVAVDAAGNLYIAAFGSHRIRKVSNGVITTVAGNGKPGYSGDNGPATSAQLHLPYGVAVDSAGNLYIADAYNNRIRKVSNGVITTVAGSGVYGHFGDDGPATSAQLAFPMGVAVDSSGNLYIADTQNLCIRKVSNGVIATVAGGGSLMADAGQATSVQLNQPQGVAVDGAGNLYIADSNRLRKVSSGMIATVAGGGSVVDDSGPPTVSELWSPGGVAVDGAGAVYIADTNNNRVRKVSDGVIGTVAGNGKAGFSGDNGLATQAQLASPHGLAVDSAGALYIADQGNGRIRKVANGVITTVAGNGEFGPGGDNGPATSAQFRWPHSVAVDAAGSLYIADFANNRIRRVSDGVITTVAGNGTYGYSGDNGLATSAQLNGPWSVAADPTGNLYVADYINNRIRKISNGVITTVAGNGAAGYSGDNGPATAAQLNNPWGVTLDGAGNLYIADSLNERIRKVSNGVITTMAGGGLTGPLGGGSFGGDGGPATSAQLNSPDGVAVDSAGNLYIADTGNDRVRVLTPASSSVLAIAGPSLLPAGQVGVAYAATVTATGGSGSYAWSATGLPAGLGMGSATGIISGTPTANSGSPYSVQVTVTDSNSANTTRAYSLTIHAAPLNSPLITGVSNAASGLASIAPNAWVSIYGANFAAAGFSDDWSKSILNGTLPTTLDGVSVSVGGIPAYVSFVSPGQINVLTPNVASGGASVTVQTAAGTSTPVTIASQPFSPAFFPWPNGQPVATHLDYSWAVKNGTFAGATTVPAKPGEYIILWGTGFGPTTPTAPTGVTIPASATYYTANPAYVAIGGVKAPVYATALAPGFAGLYQVVAMVPATLSNGDYSLVATVGGVATAATTLTVQN
jgi:uncharacterized protein (TIGR03437 family)